MAKVRNGFISNSSSSSFIIIGNYFDYKEDPSGYSNTAEEFRNDWLRYYSNSFIEITDEKIKQKIIKRIKKSQNEYPNNKKSLIEDSDVNERMFLTTYISDGSDIYIDIKYNVYNAFEYQGGNHGFPYREEYYCKIDDDKNIWLLLEDME
jgi:hypothetical protein